jgi:hypothetical protein
MKILYSAMGSSLQLFLEIHRFLMETHGLPHPAFYVSNSENYLTALAAYPELGGFASLHEWEIVNAGKTHKTDQKVLSEYEKRFGPLWNALLADRRLIFGRLTKVKQDYSTQYSHEQLMGIIKVLLDQILAFIEEVRPDVVVIFSPVTAADYLFEVVSRVKGIPFLYLKSTKIENYITFADSAIEIPALLKKRLASDKGFTEELRAKAKAVIDQTRSKGMAYEGVVSHGPDILLKQLKNAHRALFGALKRELRYRCSPIMRNDNHLPPPVLSAFHQSVMQPLKLFAALKTVKHIQQEALSSIGPYAFYPLHFEPELAVQVWGRGFQNQIEVIRNLALSVPIGMKVVVKEHPRSFGMRSLAYYRKVMAIPNVILAHPFTPAVAVIRHASLIAVISGAIGFETLVAEKPVLVFGTSPLTLLPETMVRHADVPARLAKDICQLLDGYAYDREALVRYICANLEDAVPVDLYSILLQKGHRESAWSPENQRIKKKRMLQIIGEHLLKTINSRYANDAEDVVGA